MMVIAIVLKDFSLGGGPRAVYYLCKSMPEARFIIFGCDGIMKESFEQLPNIEVNLVERWNSFTPLAIKKVIENKRIQIVHFHHLLPAILCANINIGSKIVTFHGLHIKKYLYRFNPFMKLLRKFVKYQILRNFDQSIVLTANDEKFLNKLFNNKFAEKISIIPNAIEGLSVDNEKSLTCFDKRYFNILMVARFDFPKGHDILLEHLDFITGVLKNVRFYFIGDEKVKQLIKTLDRSDAIFLSETLEPYSYIKASDALIIPSRWEGLPMVALESLSLGTKVIASNQANLDTLDDEKNVYIFNLFDKNDWIDKIEKCMNASKQPVDFEIRKFSPESIALQINNLYQQFVGEKYEKSNL